MFNSLDINMYDRLPGIYTSIDNTSSVIPPVRVTTGETTATVNVDKDWQVGFGCCSSRHGDVEIQAFEFIKGILGMTCNSWWKTDQRLFDPQWENTLRAFWSAFDLAR